MNRKQREANRANAKRIAPLPICPNCKRPGKHYAPPSFGERGFYACEAFK